MAFALVELLRTRLQEKRVLISSSAGAGTR
jgi:hypothetical protein